MVCLDIRETFGDRTGGIVESLNATYDSIEAVGVTSSFEVAEAV